MRISSRKSALFRGIVILQVLVIFYQALAPVTLSAQTLRNLPVPGGLIMTSPLFRPPLLKGIKIYPEEPFRFDFIVNKGESPYQDSEFREEANRLIKYFLAALTIPEEQIWVNLSPYEKEKIIPESLSVTEMGRDLLMQDYLLKQITASLMYPERDLGKGFWEEIYARVYKRYGTTDLPVNTFHKVWIVPEKAVVYEKGNTAYVVRSRLKVMLEQDYVSLQSNLKQEILGTDLLSEDSVKELSTVSSAVVKEIVIPALESEVNEGKHFAPLRQIYHSLILAAWFKKRLHESVLGQSYADQGKTKGIDTAERELKEKIYAQYVAAFKQGVFNYIRNDIDPYANHLIPRQYFAGGFSAQDLTQKNLAIVAEVDQAEIAADGNYAVPTYLQPEPPQEQIIAEQTLKERMALQVQGLLEELLKVDLQEELRKSLLVEPVMTRESFNPQTDLSTAKVFEALVAEYNSAYHRLKAMGHLELAEKFLLPVEELLASRKIILDALNEGNIGKIVWVFIKPFRFVTAREEIDEQLHRELHLGMLFVAKVIGILGGGSYQSQIKQNLTGKIINPRERQYPLASKNVSGWLDFSMTTTAPFYSELTRIPGISQRGDEFLSDNESKNLRKLKRNALKRINGETKIYEFDQGYRFVVDNSNLSAIDALGIRQEFFQDLEEGLPESLDKGSHYPGSAFTNIVGKTMVMIAASKSQRLVSNALKNGACVINNKFYEIYAALLRADRNYAKTWVKLALDYFFITGMLKEGRIDFTLENSLAKLLYSEAARILGGSFDGFMQVLQKVGEDFQVMKIRHEDKKSIVEVQGETIIPFDERVSLYLDQLVELDQLTFRGADQFSKEDFLDRINDRDNPRGGVNKHGFLLFYDGKLVGYSIARVKGDNAQELYYERVAVHPDFQRHPLLPAYKLTKVTFESAAKAGITQAAGDVLKTNTASQMWLGKIGYKPVMSENKGDYIRVRVNIEEGMTNVDRMFSHNSVVMFPTARNSYVGMEKGVFGRVGTKEYRLAREIYETAADVLHGDRSKYKDVFLSEQEKAAHSPMEVLKTFVFNHALFTIYQERFANFQPGRFTGMSSGQYNALVAAGFFDFREMLEYLKEVVKLHDEISKREDIRRDKIVINNIPDREKIWGVLREYNTSRSSSEQEEAAVVGNDFSPNFIVLYVKASDVESTSSETLLKNLAAKLFGNEADQQLAAGRLVLTKNIVPGAHGHVFTKYMQGPLSKLLERMGKEAHPLAKVVTTTSPQVKVIETVQEAKTELFEILGTLCMTDTIRFLQPNAYQFIEIGPGRQLTALAKEMGVAGSRVSAINELPNAQHIFSIRYALQELSKGEVPAALEEGVSVAVEDEGGMIVLTGDEAYRFEEQFAGVISRLAFQLWDRNNNGLEIPEYIRKFPPDIVEYIFKAIVSKSMVLNESQFAQLLLQRGDPKVCLNLVNHILRENAVMKTYMLWPGAVISKIPPRAYTAESGEVYLIFGMGSDSQMMRLTPRRIDMLIETLFALINYDGNNLLDDYEIESLDASGRYYDVIMRLKQKQWADGMSGLSSHDLREFMKDESNGPYTRDLVNVIVKKIFDKSREEAMVFVSELFKDDAQLEARADLIPVFSDEENPEPLGGIDLRADYLNLEIEQEEGAAPLFIPQTNPAGERIFGLTPIIINTVPILNLPAYLGLLPSAKEEPVLSDHTGSSSLATSDAIVESRAGSHRSDGTY